MIGLPGKQAHLYCSNNTSRICQINAGIGYGIQRSEPGTEFFQAFLFFCQGHQFFTQHGIRGWHLVNATDESIYI